MTPDTTLVVEPDTAIDDIEDVGSSAEPTTSKAPPEGGATAGPAPRAAFLRRAVSGRVLRRLARSVLPPLLGIAAFLGLWAALAPQVQTSLGSLPGPSDVASEGVGLYDEWQAARQARSDFYAAQDARNEALIAEGRDSEVQDFRYSGPPTFVDQVWTSLRTVGLGFLIATLVAVPLGLVSGLSKLVHAAINPLVQIFKPVSPLAWLPIVTMVVAATMTDPDPLLAPSFVISSVVVALCSLWPTLINTAVGAAAVDRDLVNVGKVLRLSWFARLRRLVLPTALPYIFTGMRLSLGVGWMVLIAAEMLSQNPGLGKFVWDEFQNGSTTSLARIMFAVIVIGLIGFMLDRVMSGIQHLASRNRTA